METASCLGAVMTVREAGKHVGLLCCQLMMLSILLPIASLG